MESPGSTSGLVADRLRDGLATREPYAGDGGSTQRVELAWLLGLCSELTDLEERACAVRYGGTGEPVPYEADRRVADIAEGDGEEITSLRPRDLDGRPVGAGWVRVQGQRERMPTYAEVGAALGLTPGQAQWALNRAHAKVERALKRRVRRVEELPAAAELVGPGKDSDGNSKKMVEA